MEHLGLHPRFLVSTPPPPPPSSLKDTPITSHRIPPPPLALPTPFQSHINQWQKEIAQFEKSIPYLTSEGHRLDSEISTTTKGITEMNQRHARSMEVLKELTVAQKFLSKADTLSQAEIIQKLESLNEEIFQLASVLADTVRLERDPDPNTERVEKFLAKVSVRVCGPAFLEVVAPVKGEGNEVGDPQMAMQIGWQAMLVEWCSWNITRWVSKESENRELGKIYHGLVNRHGLAVAGRWRAITRAVLTQSSPLDKEKIINGIVDAMSRLPVACAFISTSGEYVKLRDALRPRVEPLFEKCLDIRKILGEGVTSMDVRPYWCVSGDEYDSKNYDLEYEYDDDDGRGEEKKGFVACSLTLGLRRRIVKDGEKKESVLESILKPKVVLQSTLKEILS